MSLRSRGLRSPRAAAALAWMLWAAAPAPAQDPGGVLREGEELVYNVRYSFINLGQVRIRTIGRETLEGRTVFRCKAFIDSYPGVPFVDLHATFESWLDTAFFSRRFVGKTLEDGSWDFSRYLFDYDAGRVIMETGTRDTALSRSETTAVAGVMQDGLSLFFFARDRLRSGKAMDVPAVVRESKVNTRLNFTNGRSSVEVDAVEGPVAVVAFDGAAEFVGIFGLTGEFEGWFSDDSARVPILAKMKVIIGSITLELMEWKRPGWTPPRGGA
ncbi:MAG: DUF3108 domain-containing protein [Bacteroidota bacterium]